MSTANLPTNPVSDWEAVRDEWLKRLHDLVACVEKWSREAGWSTRRIEKEIEDSRIGRYTAPALLMQEGVVRVLLDPVTRFAPGVDGVVDLYLMPAYDDIASLYYQDGNWQLHYMFPGTPSVATIREAESQPLSKDSLQEVLREMASNAT